MTYQDYYETILRPQLEAIDLYLKTTPQPYPLKETAKICHISVGEVETLLLPLGVACITKPVFFYILCHASSFLCRLLQRQITTTGPFYDSARIAYIYNLPEKEVRQALEKMGLFCCTAGLLPALFRQIVISDKQCPL